MYDVIVIGAGATGNYTACKLAESGCRVGVLERKEQVGNKLCCTGIIGLECANSFAIEESVIYRRVNSAVLYSPSGKSLKLERREPQACVVNRLAFDRALAARAMDNGVDYLLDSTVTDLQVGKRAVKIGAISRKRSVNFESKAVVIAAGFGSKLTEQVGLGKVGDYAVGAQAQVETNGIDDIEVYFGRDIAPGFFGWLVPTLPGQAFVGLLSSHSPGRYLRKLMATLSGQGKIVSGRADLSYGAIPLKPLPRTYGERLLVVGDAAGQVKPTTGGGIYYGLLCADMAADTLLRALETDDFSARSLSGYERKWGKKLGRELRVGYWARKLYRRLSDRQVDRVFDIIMKNGIDKALLEAEDLSFDWHAGVMMKLMGYSAISRALRAVKPPFRLTR